MKPSLTWASGLIVAMFASALVLGCERKEPGETGVIEETETEVDRIQPAPAPPADMERETAPPATQPMGADQEERQDNLGFVEPEEERTQADHMGTTTQPGQQ